MLTVAFQFKIQSEFIILFVVFKKILQLIGLKMELTYADALKSFLAIKLLHNR